MRSHSARLMGLFLWLVASVAVADDDVAAGVNAFFADITDRMPGSDGNLAVEEKVAKRFAASGFEHGEIQFRAPAFQPGRTTVNVGDQTVTLLPMHPSLFRPGNFPERQFTAPVVYLGHGTNDDITRLEGQRLDGAIAVMEFNSGKSWQRFLRFGVRGFIFIGRDDYYHKEAVSKLTNTDVAVPRFFVDAQSGAALRAQLQAAAGSVSAEFNAEPSRWKNRDLRNLWVLIPGSNPDLAKEVVVVVAPLDSSNIVPQMAEGAASGTNLYLLLHMLEQFTQQAPARSVLLAAVNARSRFFQGDRMLAWHLLAANSLREELRNILAEEVREAAIFDEHYSKLDLTDSQNEQTRQQLIDMRFAEDRSTKRNVQIKEPVVALAKRDVNQLKGEKLRLMRLKLPEDEEERRRKPIDLKLQRHVNVLTLFNKVGSRTELNDLTDDELVILRGYVDEVLTRSRRRKTLNEQDLAVDIQNSAIQKTLAGRKVVFTVTLEFNWRSDEMGFASQNSEKLFESLNPGQWARGFGLRSTAVANQTATQLGLEASPLLDTMTSYAGLGEPHYFANPFRSSLSCYQLPNPNPSMASPAFALRNAFAQAGESFTPGDRFERLDPERLQRHFAFLSAYIPALLADDRLTKSNELGRPRYRHTTRAVHVKAFEFDEFDASLLPKLAVPNSAIALYPQSGFAVYDDVVSVSMALTDERATAVFYNLFTGVDNPLSSRAFHFENDDFITVTHAIDAGDVQEKTTTNSNIVGKKVEDKVLTLFRCREFPIWERNDPSLLSNKPILVNQFQLLGGKSNASPRKYGISGTLSTLSTKKMLFAPEGPAALYVAGEQRIKLLGNGAIAINATDDEPEGIGYESDADLGYDFIAAGVRDLSALNRYRLGRLPGVTNELAADFLARGDAALGEMNDAREANRHLDYLGALYEAVGAQSKAYSQTQSTTNDMLKAIIFYMALLLPFCFFLQKLLFKFVRIEAQMICFFLLFVGTFICFRTIHPAFRVAEAPEAIFVAFMMGVLGMFVVSILHGRFEGEMKLLFSAQSGAGAADVGYSTVGQKAMLIGVNNMKRRRIRTILTTATIVLVTFTMLAFSGISKKVSPTMVPITSDAKYNGIFFQWPGNLLMGEATLQTLDDLFAQAAETMVVRRWLVPKVGIKGQVDPIRVSGDNGNTINVDAFLGLQLADNDFLSPDGLPFVAGHYFSADDAHEAILPLGTADALNIAPTDVGKTHIRLNGYDLRVVGILDDVQFRALRDLNNRPIVPIKNIDTPGRTGNETSNQQQLQLDPGGADDSNIFYADTSALVVTPANFLKNQGGRPFSISIKLPENVSVWPAVDRLLTATKARIYMGSPKPFKVGSDNNDKTTSAGVYYLGEGYKTSIGGLARLIIPLLIAGTILLNTMLGSVFERKSEIAIYNAIGLNPTHIGMFFLAEAFVYSVIGSVGGYLIGQVASIGITKFSLIEGINLNFSSLTVVYVILFTIAIVLLSTLYPAVVATRAAVPSGKRTWSLPDHDGHKMEIVFPFIYQPRLAPGVIAYLYEYFSRYTEASVGELIVSDFHHHIGKDGAGRDTYKLAYNMALAPFDLGVTQHVVFHAVFEEKLQSYMVTMNIERISGQDSNWVTTNSPFLERLRKYLLNWRNLDASQHALFVEQAQQLNAST